MTARSYRSMAVRGVVFALAICGQEPFALADDTRLGACTNPQAKQVAMYYVNGVATNRIEADKNRAGLSAVLRSSLSGFLDNTPVCILLRYKYNPSSGGIKDFLESAQQIDKLSPRWLYRFFATGAVSLDQVEEPAGDPVDRQSFVNAAVATALGKLVADSSLIQASVINAHAATYEADLRACRSVVLVPHSQGNLYAHMAYDKLVQNIQKQEEALLNAVRIVGVGSPDVDTINDGSSYWARYRWRTSYADAVMGAVSLWLGLQPGPGRLKSNTLWFPNIVQWARHSAGHSFLGYLTFSSAKGQIVDDLISQLLALPYGGCPQFSQDTYSAPVSSTATTATITLVRSSAAEAETVTVSTVDGEPGYTAVAGVDYTPISTDVAFPKDVTTATVTVPILSNSSRNNTVRVLLRLVESSNRPLGDKVTATLSIPPEASCTDNSPNLSAYVFDGHQEKTQVAPSISVSTSSSLNGVTSSAQGTKGNVNVSVSALGGNPPTSRMNYKATFIVSSPGKTGRGTAIITPQGSGSVSLTCAEGDGTQTGGYAWVKVGDPFPYVAIGESANCLVGRLGAEGPVSSAVEFFYESPLEFNVLVEAWTRHLFAKQGTTASAVASLTGYSVTVPNDPDAKVTFCRAMAPAP